MSTKQCTVCNEAAAKYKCPKCRVGYCSVKCFKIHKTEPCMAMATTDSSSTAQNLQQSTPSASSGKELSTNTAQINDDDEEEAKHRLTAEDLNKLDTSTRVKELLMNPETRALLEAVRKDPSPLEAIRALRQRSDFEELVQALISATGRAD